MQSLFTGYITIQLPNLQRSVLEIPRIKQPVRTFAASQRTNRNQERKRNLWHPGYYPLDRCQENQFRHLLNRNLSGGQRYLPFEQLGPVVQETWVRKITNSCSNFPFYLSYNNHRHRHNFNELFSERTSHGQSSKGEIRQMKEERERERKLSKLTVLSVHQVGWFYGNLLFGCLYFVLFSFTFQFKFAHIGKILGHCCGIL